MCHGLKVQSLQDMSFNQGGKDLSMTVMNVSDGSPPPPSGPPPPGPLPAAHLGALVVLSLGGAISNSLLLAVIGCSRSLRTLSTVFLVLLTLADLAVCLSALPLTSAALPGAPNQPWTNVPYACDIAGVFYILFRWTSLLSVSVISIDRCVAIRAPLRYPKLLTKQRAAVTVLVLLGATGVLSILPVAGIGRYAYSPGGGLCTPDYPHSPAYGLLLLVGASCLPLVVTFVAYGVVAEVALRTAKRGKIVCDEVSCSYVASRRDEVKPVQTLATITGVYALCWVPYIGVNLWSLTWNQRSTRPLEALTECLVLLSSALNPWVYSMMDRNIRTAIITVSANAKTRILNHWKSGTQGVTAEGVHPGGRHTGEDQPRQLQGTPVLTFSNEGARRESNDFVNGQSNVGKTLD